jgi:uncharacterized protein YidB (DUF937 family)
MPRSSCPDPGAPILVPASCHRRATRRLSDVNAARLRCLYGQRGGRNFAGGAISPGGPVGEAMRLLHEVIDDPRRLPDEPVNPIGAALAYRLGGERGTLSDLADRSTRAGLGDIIGSWIGDGPALPIGVQGLRRVLGDERVGDFATRAGLSSQDFLVHFARRLPGAVHQMRPGGSAPGTALSRRLERGGRRNSIVPKERPG